VFNKALAIKWHCYKLRGDKLSAKHDPDVRKSVLLSELASKTAVIEPTVERNGTNGTTVAFRRSSTIPGFASARPCLGREGNGSRTYVSIYELSDESALDFAPVTC
jgi:hypothetical protein